MKAFLVFPNQLFRQITEQDKDYIFYLLEDPEYLDPARFSVHKLIHHRATLKFMADILKKKGFAADYMETKPTSDRSFLNGLLKANAVTEIHYYDPLNDRLEKRIRDQIAREIITVKHPSPLFLTGFQEEPDQVRICSREGSYEYKPYDHPERREQETVLFSEPFEAYGEKKQMSPAASRPELWIPEKNAFVQEAIRYVASAFGASLPEGTPFVYAVTHADAKNWLRNFIAHRLTDFGPFTRAMEPYHSSLFHSALVPYLSTGLLTPEEVIRETKDYGKASLISRRAQEELLKQVIHWKDLMRAMYLYTGIAEPADISWNQERKLPETFRKATGGIMQEGCIVKNKVTRAYYDHVGLLTVMGNYMMLGGFDPDDVYQWLMEMYSEIVDILKVSLVTAPDPPRSSDPGYDLSTLAGADASFQKRMNNERGRPVEFGKKHNGFFCAGSGERILSMHLKKSEDERVKKNSGHRNPVSIFS